MNTDYKKQKPILSVSVSTVAYFEGKDIEKRSIEMSQIFCKIICSSFVMVAVLSIASQGRKG